MCFQPTKSQFLNCKRVSAIFRETIFRPKCKQNFANGLKAGDDPSFFVSIKYIIYGKKWNVQTSFIECSKTVDRLSNM